MAGSDNFTGQNIQDSYQRVLQISSSGELADGTGSLVPLLYVTASHAITEVNYETSSSYADTASYFDTSTTTFKETGHRNGDSVITGSLVLSGSGTDASTGGKLHLVDDSGQAKAATSTGSNTIYNIVSGTIEGGQVETKQYVILMYI